MIYFVTQSHRHDISFGEEIEHESELQKVVDYCSVLPTIVFDTETTDLDAYVGHILLLILGDSENQFVIDATCYTSSELSNMFISIGLDKLYLGQNLKFDYKFTKVKYGIELRNLHDTMIAEQILLQNSGVGNGLVEIIQRRLKISPAEMNKDIRMEFVGANPETFVFKNHHIDYSAGDIKYLLPIKVIQDELIKKAKQEFLVTEIEFPLISILGDCELVGFVLDEKKWEENIEFNKAKRFEYQGKLDEELRSLRDKLVSEENRIYLTGGKFDRIRPKEKEDFQFDLFGGVSEVEKKDDKKAYINYGSTDQLVNILGRLGQPVPTLQGKHVIPEFVKNAKGKEVIDKSAYNFTTGEGVIEGYLIENPNTPIYIFIKHLIEYREASTRLNTFGRKFIKNFTNKVTKKVHTIFRQCTAATGRLQSGDTKHGWFNSQNIPADKKYREAFRTDEGRLISTTDLSGAEAVIMIDKAKDETFYNIAIVNDDAHSPLCQAVWRAIGEHRLINSEPDSEEWQAAEKLANIVVSKKENKDKRTDYKPMTFGDIYGMHDKKRAKTLNVSIEEAKIAGRVQKSMLPKTYRMVEANSKFALANGYIILNTRTNRRMWYPKVQEARKYNTQLSFMDEHDVGSSARNSPIQGTQADMIKECMVVIWKECLTKELDIKLLGQVHDELIYDFPKHYMDEAFIKFVDDAGDAKLVDAGDFIKLTMIKVCNRYLSFIKIGAEQHVGETWTK